MKPKPKYAHFAKALKKVKEERPKQEATGVPFKPGNQFWMLRSKHGRDRLFASPADLWDAACEYFAWCEANPLMEVDFRGKDAEKVNLPKMRAFTYQGLTRYLNCNIQYLNEFEQSIVGKTDELSRDFSAIITCVRETIYEQKFTGAAAGFLNPNIIARDLGLVDKTNNAISIDSNKKTVNDLFPEELKDMFNEQADTDKS